MRIWIMLITMLIGISGAVWIQYADNFPYVQAWHLTANGDTGYGQRFTPPFNPGVIANVGVFVGNPPTEAPDLYQGFDISVWSYSSSTGLPGSRLPWPGSSPPIFTKHFPNTREDDWNFYYIHFNWNTSQDFVIHVIQVGSYPSCDSIWRDTAIPLPPNPNRNFERYNNIWSSIWMQTSTQPGDLMMKVEYLNNTELAPTSLGAVKASYR